MRSCDRCDHGEPDWDEADVSSSRCDWCRYRIPRDIDHLVQRGSNRREAYGNCFSCRIAGCDRASRSHCSACDHELVFSQDLLGWMDSSA